MSFSAQLIEELKTRKGFTKDAEVVVVLPKVTKGILSEIKTGKRHLTEEQALWIASECQLNAAMVLVELAAETSRSEDAKTVWSNLAKKIKAAASTAIVAAFLMVSAVPAPNPPQRIRNIP